MKQKKQPEVICRDVAVVEADIDIGLTGEQARERAVKGWSNGMPQSASKTEKEIVLEKCLTFFNLVFIILALVLVIGGSSIKNMTFLGVMVCNTVIGIFQEIRAKRAVDKLTLVAVQQVRTIRDGKLQKIRSSKLVRDDIVEFAAGDQICADGILRSGTMQVNESLVTGEEDAIVKKPGDELKSGSFVVAGTGRAQLTKVGADSFAAKLALEAKANPQASKSEMMRSLDKLIRVVGFGLIPIGIILFYQSFSVLGQPLRESTEGTVAALIGMIPEGLYLLTSVAMAVSALKLTQKKVLVQDMNCIETLARVDVLCVDKTGTITEAVMEVDNVVPLTDDDPERLEQILAAIYTGVEPDNDTARAMTEMFAGQTDWECVNRIPFTSKTKWSSATFREQGAYIVGAPEFIMGSRYDELREYVESWSGFGYRVLLVAEYAGEPSPEGLVAQRLKPLALVLVSNRVRPEAEETFRYFAQQGVCIKVISGDNPVTVSEVARRAGIENADQYVDAGVLESDKDFLQAVEEYTVFGRVTPDKKKKLILALQKKGHTVAMTGDGVNDVLAMKQADCGIAMASGAQAASQVAQLVLLNSDFSAMPSIVAEGRRVINNIQRAATLFLVKNIFSLGLSIINLIAGLQYPLQPIHLSVISTLTIGAPSFFLAMEPNYERVQGRFLPTVMRKALPGGLTNIFVVLMAQLFMVVFGMALEQVSPVCAAILAVVGLLVLYQTCKPFGKIRKLIWWMMAAGLLICFTFFKGFLELRLEDHASSLVMVVLLIMTPTVFFAAQRVFDWGDKLSSFLARKLKRK
ncbi:MAG: cation-translocating P-type ATPase [Oscillospiraceae bacterium]|nr:cation-translocating P-type ATPase [Oscillospiraceae bacterium]